MKEFLLLIYILWSIVAFFLTLCMTIDDYDGYMFFSPYSIYQRSYLNIVGCLLTSLFWIVISPIYCILATLCWIVYKITHAGRKK